MSKDQPFCDGTHFVNGSNYKPLRFVYDGPTDEGTDTKDVFLCTCKLNKVSKGPFCDGSHNKIVWDELYKNYKVGFNDDTKEVK